LERGSARPHELRQAVANRGSGEGGFSKELGNLLVPVRLSPRWWGWLNPKRVPIAGGRDEAHLVGIFSGQQSGNLTLGVL